MSGDKAECLRTLELRDRSWLTLLHDPFSVDGLQPDSAESVYGVLSHPTTLLVDPEGIIVKRLAGWGDNTLEVLLDALKIE